MATIKEQLAARAKRLAPVKLVGLESAFLRRIDGTERIVYCDACAAAKDAESMTKAMKTIVAFCLCDSAGVREYANADEVTIDGEDLEALAKEAAAVNGLGPDKEGQEKKAPPATPGATSA